MDLTKYDDLLARILEEEHQIYPFLDVIFGFLWRRSDFFLIQKEGGKLGFPHGGAEKIILSVFKKWQNCSRSDSVKPTASNDNKPKIIGEYCDCTSVVNEETVTTMKDDNQSKVSGEQKFHEEISKKKNIVDSSDIYNGADRGTYRWSQTISDIEVLIPVAEHIRKSKDVNVNISDTKLAIKCKDETDHTAWKPLIDGEFCFKVNKEDSVWSLSPGHLIEINLDKKEERWWDALLTSEPKLDTKKFDASRPMSDLSEEEQMKVEELIWNEERKQHGLKTSEQIKAEKILKDAWNAEGSPFKGTEFNPDVLNFNQNSMDFQGNG